MVIRDILAECECECECECVVRRDGGDESWTWADGPGAGPATRVDVADTKRCRAATALER
ncbi:hypothetical protein AB0H18_14325 [Streptomyces sp. NPDC020766]|uniref:hypothetical protein n=1 Tax=Streptomyces sp. NPDC020766 TaxID=3155011 RepID=UPI0034058148